MERMPRYCVALMLGIAAVSAGHCAAEEYLLRMEQLAASAPEPGQIKMGSGVGWVDKELGESQVDRAVEIRISTASPFHLTLRERDETVELRGEVEKQQPSPVTAGTQHADLLIRVTYQCTRENGGRTETASTIPLRFGKKWYLKGPGRQFPVTLWSVQKVTADR